MLSNFFLRKSCRLWGNVEKFCRPGQNTHGNMAYAHSMLDDYSYKYTLISSKCPSFVYHDLFCWDKISRMSYLAHFFLQRESFQTKVTDKIEKHILCSVTFFPENRAGYETMWKNSADPVRTHMVIWLMRIPCWMTMITITHSGYLVLIAFPVQNAYTTTLRCYVIGTLPVSFPCNSMSYIIQLHW